MRDKTFMMDGWGSGSGVRHHHGFPGGDEGPAGSHGGPRGRGGRRGPGGFGGPRGFGGPGGPGGPGGRGRARGDIRAAVLALLAEQERHGYDLIRAIEERTSGAWAPSPGSIYPTLQSLEDEGLVTITLVDGRKVASVTEAGRTWVSDHVPHPDSLFAQPEGGAGVAQVRSELVQLRDAAMHVTRQLAHDEGHTAQIAAILAAARKDLYRLLAEQD